MQRALITGCIIVLACGAAGCGKSAAPPSGPTGKLSAEVGVSGPLHDVTSVRFKVVGAADTCDAPALASTTVSLSGATADVDAGHVTVENALALAPGTYRVCATPLAANGQPSAFCGPSQTLTTVVAGGLAEVTLVSQCTGDVGGTVVFNDPPEITGLLVPAAGTIAACVPAAITVAATDPNGDALTYAWTVTSGPGDATIDGAGATASFTAPVAGTYELRVAVSDPLGARAALTFPVAVAAGRCGGMDAAAGTTGASGAGGGSGGGAGGSAGSSGAGGSGGGADGGAAGADGGGGGSAGGAGDGGVMDCPNPDGRTWYGDFDGDGVDDCAVPIPGSMSMWTSVAFHKGVGSGLYAATAVVSADLVTSSFSMFAVGDLNGDHRADIAITQPSTTTTPFLQIVILRGQADGTFIRRLPQSSAYSSVFVAEPSVGGPMVADVNGDGVNDLLFAGWPADSSHVVHWLTLFTNDPLLDPFVEDTSSSLGAGAYGSAGIYLTVDLNGDSKLDAVGVIYVHTLYQMVTNNDYSDHPQLAIALGNGDGTFQTPSTLIASTDGVRGVTASDVNRDGKLDLLAAMPSGTVTYYGDGAGNFSTTPPP